MNRTTPVLFVLLLVLAACAGSGATPPPSSERPDSGSPAPTDDAGGGGDAIEHPTGADEAILIVDSAGGMLPVDLSVGQLPAFVLLGDGRVIMQGMQTLEFPGPLLTPLIERTLTEAGIQEVLRGIEETNLFTSDAQFRGMMSMVADATDTIFIVDAGGLQSTVTVYALGMLTPDLGEVPGMTPGEEEAHRRLQQLNDALMTIDAVVDAEGWEAEGWRPYEPEAIRLYVRDASGEPVDGGDLPEHVRDWPADGDPAAFGEDAGLGNGTRCGVVTGEEAALWLSELNQATQMTRWTDDGERRFSIMPRPVLPHEQPVCPDLFGG